MLPSPPACKIDNPLSNQLVVLPLPTRQRRSYLPSPLKSRCPTTDQPGTVPNPPACRICPPFMSHAAVFPLVSFQRMSLLPSPFRSCVFFGGAGTSSELMLKVQLRAA